MSYILEIWLFLRFMDHHGTVRMPSRDRHYKESPDLPCPLNNAPIAPRKSACSRNSAEVPWYSAANASVRRAIGLNRRKPPAQTLSPSARMRSQGQGQSDIDRLWVLSIVRCGIKRERACDAASGSVGWCTNKEYMPFHVVPLGDVESNQRDLLGDHYEQRQG